MVRRYLEPQIKQDLDRKMVFVSGPRQVGKTTLAKRIIKTQLSYLNWDIPEHRKKILLRQLPTTKFLCFDEIHKYKDWRDYLKGIYDQFHTRYNILVTGSARLDLFRKRGDSLQGRYHHLRLHPLSVKELKLSTIKDLENLLTLGGFPEPYYGQSKVQAKRWSNEYRSLLVNIESPSIENISDLGKLELLSLRLPELVGSPLSVNALREDLQVTHKTAARWLDILENIYYHFRLSPFGSPRIRAVKKEQKHYHFDWTLIENKGHRFENMVACHLLKWVHYRQDCFGEHLQLMYFRDTDKREVDFCIVKNRKPLQFIECKYKGSDTSPHLIYLHKKFPKAQSFQLNADGKNHFITKHNIKHIPAIEFLSGLI